MKGKIIESGNGLNVNVGDYAYSDNTVYRVTDIGAGTIQTAQWKPNWMNVEVEYVGEPSDIESDEFEAAWNVEVMERRQAYRLMDAADVVRDVSNWTQNVAESDMIPRAAEMVNRQYVTGETK